MKRLKRFWQTIPRKTRAAINLLAITILGLVLYVFLGYPAFTPVQRYRRLEKANMVGPAEILAIYDLENSGYLHLLLADDEDAVIFYLYSDIHKGTERFFYREKNEDLTVLAAPCVELFSYWEYELDLPVFLFDDHPAAHRAELELTLSETVNDVYFEKEYLLESTREEDGFFLFNIHAESDNWYVDDFGREHGKPLGAEGVVLSQFSQMCGYDDSFNLRPQPVTVRLYDENDQLILEEEILVHCLAGQAHAQRGELELPD